MDASSNAAAGATTSSKREPVNDNAVHILCVDDDDRISDLVKQYLTRNGYRATVAVNAAQARTVMTNIEFDAIILDVMMPGDSGLIFAREIRKSSEIPILMLTANSEPDQIIEGLETGVDDYLTKPFDPRELLLRIKSILRRIDTSADNSDEIQMGEFTFFVARGDLKHGEQSIKITERERELLRQFAQSPGQPIPRHELAGSSETSGTERAVDVQINRLRRKIEADPSNPVYLQTVRGKGYILHSD